MHKWQVPHEVQELLETLSTGGFDDLDEAPVVQVRITARRNNATVEGAVTQAARDAAA